MIGKIIRNVRLQRNLSVTDLAKKADLDVGHLSHIERGERFPSYKALKEICNALEISSAQLLNYTGKELNEEQEKYEFVKYVPYNMIPVVEIKEYIEAPQEYVKNLVAVIASDDSMKDTIKKGSKVLVEFYVPLNNEDIGLFVYNSKVMIRKFKLKGNKIILEAYNKEYSDIEIKENDEFKIIGKVVE